MRISLAFLLAGASACSFDRSGVAGQDGDGGEPPDAMSLADAAIDAAEIDAMPIDAMPIDAPPIDAMPIDAMPIDAMPIDAMPIDGTPPIVDDIVHVPVAAEYQGTDDVTLVDGTVIDTTDMTITGTALPPGVTFDTSPQDGGGPELAILHADDLSVAGSVRVLGTRPFVVIAATITIGTGARLDAGARRSQAGANGADPGAGPAPGLNGEHTGTYSDSGGGGGGHATAGGAGGDAVCGFNCSDASGGAGGGIVGDAAITVLQGGSGGGIGPLIGGCTIPLPGAGGGAVQLYARVSIQLDGRVNAGGGGGGQGEQCTGNWSAASGGGSGGSIYLQTPVVSSTGGELFANGGGGGGSAGTTGDGAAGANGGPGTSTAGGTGAGTYAEDGGSGGGSALAAQPGGDAPDDGNGGGGGGATGRIAVRTKSPVIGTITTSPAPDIGSY